MKWVPENFKGIVAGIVILASFGYFFLITFWQRTADPQVIIAIVAAMSNVLQYYFGSSQGANKTNELLANNQQSTIANSETTILTDGKTD